MRETKSFSIEGHDKTFEVYELSIKEWKRVLDPHNFEGSDLADLVKSFTTRMLPFGSNVTAEELDDLTPSEVDVIWQAFQEVNKTFFGLSDRLGIKGMFQEIRPALLGAFGGLVVDWLKQATPTPPTTGTPTSSTRSTNTKSPSLNRLPTPPGPSKLEPTETKKPGSSS